jgi:hypothetical protein
MSVRSGWIGRRTSLTGPRRGLLSSYTIPFPSSFEARDMEYLGKCSRQIEAQPWLELVARCVSGKKHAEVGTTCWLPQIDGWVTI